MDRNHLREAFGRYVATYDADDPKIRLKIEHSYRVAELTEQIAESVDGADPEFAWAMGLLHDIGRFEQVRRYGTFIDAESVDHAQLGADLLFCEGLLEELMEGLGSDDLLEGPGCDDLLERPESGLTAEHRHLMETAIRNHSVYRIPEGLSETERMYCDILRDADKIDIFRVLCETPTEEIYDVSTEELKSAAVSDEVKACFLARTAVLRSKRKTAIDKIVGHVCLTFELVYPASSQIAREQGYVDRLLGFQSENRDTAEWFAYMREQVWE